LLASYPVFLYDLAGFIVSGVMFLEKPVVEERVKKITPGLINCLG
jgi:hypothetical protein